MQASSSHNDLKNEDSNVKKASRGSITSSDHSLLSDRANYQHISTKVTKKRLSSMQPTEGRNEGVPFRGFSNKLKTSKNNEKIFPRSESLEAFPPLTKKFSRRQHSRSP